MNRAPLQSQMLRSVGYDPESCVLELEFEAGTVYRYFDVPEFTYRALIHAPSKGRFFTTGIQNRFRCEEVR